MNPANDTPRSDSECLLCCNCHFHPRYPTETAPPDLCWYHWCWVRAESMQPSQDTCRSTQKRCIMSRKKALEAKNKEQIALSSLPAVPHAYFPLLCPSSGCFGVRPAKHHLQWSSLLSQIASPAQPEGRKIPYFPHIVSWAGRTVMWAKQQEGGLLSFFQH